MAPQSKRRDRSDRLAYYRAWRARNKSHLKAYERKRSRSSKRRAACAQWKKDHPEKTRAQGRRWYKANRKRSIQRSRNNQLLRDYGITLVQLEAMLEKQCRRCLICKKNPAVAVDHNHRTGKIRGILCRMCNIGIGGFKDDPKLCQQAAKYLHERPGH